MRTFTDSLWFEVDGQQYVLVTDGVPPYVGQGLAELPAYAAAQVLRRAARQGIMLPRSRHALATLGGPSLARTNGFDGDPFDDLPFGVTVYELRRDTGWLNLSLVEPDDLAIDLYDCELLPARAAPEDEWVEVLVVDADDRPLALVEYEIRLSDGRVRRGRTNEDGILYYDEIPAGTCELEILGHDASQWELAS